MNKFVEKELFFSVIAKTNTLIAVAATFGQSDKNPLARKRKKSIDTEFDDSASV
jgi:hypothetical protein